MQASAGDTTVKFEIRSRKFHEMVERKLRKISECDTPPENKDLVLACDREASLNGKKAVTRFSNLLTLHNLCRFAKNKCFKQFTREDIAEFLERVKKKDFDYEKDRTRFKSSSEPEVAESTLNLRKQEVRKFFCYVHGAGRDSYPDCVKWLRVRAICGKGKQPDEMLTPEEVRAMIAATDNPRDRALISVMAESGARLGEIVTARIRDVRFNHRGFSLTVDGKTGTRTIPLCVSETDLKDWLNNYHPFKGYPDAPLFTTYTDKRKGGNLRRHGVEKTVRFAAARARIDKRVYPHLLRHTRATELARLGWTEPMLKKFFGWSNDSRMPATYIHLAETDIEDKYYEMYGKGEVKREPKPPLAQQPLLCPACKQKNPTGFLFCFNCNEPLSGTSARRAKATNILDLIVEDDELRQQFDALLEMAYKKQHGR